MSKNIYVFLADGFELIEAMTPVDVLRRAGLNVKTVSINNTVNVTSAQNVSVIADMILSNADFLDGDMIIIPGGFPGFVNLRENKKIVDIVKKYLENDKYVGAICGGPTVLGVNELMGDFKYTSHFSVKDEIKGGTFIGGPVVVDRKLITSQGAGHALAFAFELAKVFVDSENIEKVKKGMELS